MTVTRPETPMTRTGWCEFPSPQSHEFCQTLGRPCTCPCHEAKPEEAAS